MRFVCDSCRAQYMISDDKVGAKGVKVRCKKCGYVILVRKGQSAAPAPAPQPQIALGDAGDNSATQVMENPLGQLPPSPRANFDPDVTNPATQLHPNGANGRANVLGSVPDDEISSVFDQVLNSKHNRIPEGGEGQEALGDTSDDRMSTRVLDADMVKKLADESAGSEAKNGAAKNGEGSNHDWFVAVDEKQVGPLNVDKIKAMWDRGEIGPDSLCWRAGFSDWTALSEVQDLASTLAPKPQKPMIVAPASVGVPAVVTVPVESAFSAGGVTRTVRSEVAVMAGAAPGEETGGWKPSAASALQSLVKDEIDALTKPASKGGAHSAGSEMVEEKAKPQLGGLLDGLPESTPQRGNGRVAGPMGEAMSPMAPAYAPPPYQAAYPQYRPGQDDSSKKMIIIGAAVGGVLLLLLLLLVGYLLGNRGNAGIADRGERDRVASNPPPPPAPTPVQVKSPVALPTPNVAPVPVTNSQSGTPPPPTVGQPTTPPRVHSGSESSHKGSSEGTPREHKGEVARADKPPEEATPSKRVAVAEPKGDDDEFAKTFGGSARPAKASKGDDSEGVKEKPKHQSAGYIPPEPGAGGDVPDQVSQSDIMQTVVSHKPEIVECVKKQKAKDPDATGTLVMKWTIQNSGSTSGVTPVTEEYKTAPIASCMGGLIKGWHFPKHKSPQDPINFPFKF